MVEIPTELHGEGQRGAKRDWIDLDAGRCLQYVRSSTSANLVYYRDCLAHFHFGARDIYLLSSRE